MACLEFLFIQYTYCESTVDKGMRVRSDRSVDWCLDWCLTGGILLKKQFLKFRNTDKKTPALESLFNRVAGRPATVLNEASTIVFFCKYCENFKNTHFQEQLQTTASAVPTSYCKYVFLRASFCS